MTPRLGYLELVFCLFAVAPGVLCQVSQTEPPPNLEFQKFETAWPKIERKFFIYSKDHPQGVEFGILELPPYLKNETETKIITHGYKESKNQIQAIVDEYLKVKDVNIISFDWSPAANMSELHAAIATAYFGRFVVGSFVDQLIKKYNIKFEQIHLIGYNMGAHLMGQAGKALKGNIGRITGLDPYKTYFDESNLVTISGLKAADAKFVDVFHTNGGNISIAVPIGIVDFYPNGGTLQPKCVEDKSALCNALMAKEYFAESISKNESFWGVQCATYEDFTKNLCKDKPMIIAGEFGNSTAVHGSFFFQTNAKSPYGRGKNGTTPQI